MRIKPWTLPQSQYCSGYNLGNTNKITIVTQDPLIDDGQQRLKTLLKLLEEKTDVL